MQLSVYIVQYSDLTMSICLTGLTCVSHVPLPICFQTKPYLNKSPNDPRIKLFSPESSSSLKTQTQLLPWISAHASSALGQAKSWGVRSRTTCSSAMILIWAAVSEVLVWGRGKACG